ncbi:MAG: hypothetical protein ICV62_09815 [Cyanobacteria bacterium Co-bin13]|nr:hypothetical protein [Cyanobacteria bacterium Co-bin13]
MTIKAIRAGSKSRKRQLSATYTQAQVDLLIQSRMQSYRQVAHELRQLILELSTTRQAGRFSEHVEVRKAALLKVLTKSADLADF